MFFEIIGKKFCLLMRAGKGALRLSWADKMLLKKCVEMLERFCFGNIIEMTIAGYRLFSMSERREYGYKGK